jgi:hypothetical protein
MSESDAERDKVGRFAKSGAGCEHDSVAVADLRVCWRRELEGGGTSFGLQFPLAIQERIGPVEDVCEVCSGVGIIGFSLLQAGLCRRLCLIDINAEAIDLVNCTIQQNGLEDSVRCYVSDGFHGIPQTECWDLVIGNPPHYNSASQGDSNIIRCDPGWRFHREFYSAVGSYLKPHGSVLLIENWRGSEPALFLSDIASGGLALIEAFMVDDPRFILDQHYFIWTRKRSNRVIPSTEVPESVVVRVSSLLAGPLDVEFKGDRSYAEILLVNDIARDATIGVQDIGAILVQRGNQVSTGRFITHKSRTYVFVLPDAPPNIFCSSA